MPRKAKEKVDEIEIKKEKKSVAKKATAEKKATTVKKSATTKKATSTKKPSVTKKTSTATKSSKKEAPVKKTSSRKSVLARIIENIDNEAVEVEKKAVKKSSTKKEGSKEKTDKKSVSKIKKDSKTESVKKATKKSPKQQTVKRTTKKSNKQPVQILEYYDLPYKYGNTVVRLLAQTPKTLFVYWEVSDSDIENFKKTYGDDFFNKTKPILIVHNLTLNKTTEIEINDFANCWYLNTDDTDCKFDIELARKFIEPVSNTDVEASDYLYLAQSNDLQSPNNHILFEKIQEFVVFRNVNNDNVVKKNIKSFKFLKDIYKFYKDMYDEEVLNNPSSQFKF